MSNSDVVVVGGGAAGLSAALVLSGARRKVLVLMPATPQRPSGPHEGSLSRDGMPPAELLAHGREEVRGYGGRVVTGSVESMTATHKGGCDGPRLEYPY